MKGMEKEIDIKVCPGKRQDPTLYLALIYIWICIWMDLAHELDHERQELIHDHPDRSDAP